MCRDREMIMKQVWQRRVYQPNQAVHTPLTGIINVWYSLLCRRQDAQIEKQHHATLVSSSIGLWPVWFHQLPSGRAPFSRSAADPADAVASGSVHVERRRMLGWASLPRWRTRTWPLPSPSA